MSKLARACAAAVAVATSLAGGIAAAQIQGGVARKAAPPAVALGVPVAKATIGQRSSSGSTSGSGSSLSFASGQPALRYQPIDLPTAKDPVRREAVKDGAKEAHASARGAAAGATSTPSTTGEFAPAPGVLRANMPPVTFADAGRVLKTRVLPTNVNQGVTAAPKAGKTSTSTSTATSLAKIAGDAAASGPASIAELARALRHHLDLIYQYVRNNVEYYPNRTNIRNNLATYATQLASHLRANKPAATLDDVLGGKTIVPFYGALRQTSLPHQNTAWGSEELAELPGYMKPTLRVQYQGIDQTYTSDAIYGRRLTLTYNGANQPVLKLDGVAVGNPGTAVTYDANANLTSFTNATYKTTTFAYGLPGQMTKLGYDAEGRLRQTAIGTTTTNLLYDAANLIAEYDAAGATLQRRYVHGPGTDEPIVWYEGSGTTAKNWFYADHLGSIVATANATGASTGIYSYGPYGEPNTTTGPRFRYTGQQLIGDLGLYHYKARFYSSSLGRFLQTDPIGYKDDVNLYAYVGNNPGNRIDPTGLASLGAWASSARASSSLSTLAGDISWIDGGTAPAGTGDASYQVAWTTPMDMLNAKRNSLLESGGGGNGGAGGSGGPTYSTGGAGTNYIVTPGGTVFPVPRGSVGPTPSSNSAGLQTGSAYTGGAGGANGQVSTMRIMDATRAGGGNPGNPTGYIKYENSARQPVNPYTGRTIPNSEAHYPIDR